MKKVRVGYSVRDLDGRDPDSILIGGRFDTASSALRAAKSRALETCGQGTELEIKIFSVDGPLSSGRYLVTESGLEVLGDDLDREIHRVYG